MMVEMTMINGSYGDEGGGDDDDDGDDDDGDGEIKNNNSKLVKSIATFYPCHDQFCFFFTFDVTLRGFTTS